LENLGQDVIDKRTPKEFNIGVAGIESRLLASEEYVWDRVRTMTIHGFLPPIDPQNFPTIEQMKETLSSQEFLTENCPSNQAIVPQNWESDSGEAIFRKAEVRDGKVISVDIISVVHDSRKVAKIAAERAIQGGKEHDLVPKAFSDPAYMQELVESSSVLTGQVKEIEGTDRGLYPTNNSRNSQANHF